MMRKMEFDQIGRWVFVSFESDEDDLKASKYGADGEPREIRFCLVECEVRLLVARLQEQLAELAAEAEDDERSDPVADAWLAAET